MKLSIIIPIYNEERTLQDIYNRIVSVAFPVDLELILVDDCSNDRSKEIANQLLRVMRAYPPFLKRKMRGKVLRLLQVLMQ